MCNGFYDNLYARIGALTPLKSDCGRMCGGACCSVGDDLPGMFLFPGEEALYQCKMGFALHTTELPGYGPVTLLDCGGACQRHLRPLSCRVFPLAPRVQGDAVTVRLDPRGRAICPLSRGSRGALHGEFVDAVHDVFEQLLRDPETAPFLRTLSREIDEFVKPL